MVKLLRLFFCFILLALQAVATKDFITNSTTPSMCSFLSFCAMYNKHYSSAEELNLRFGIFLQNKAFIDNYPPSTF